MRNKLTSAGAVALAVFALSQVQTPAPVTNTLVSDFVGPVTNGTIIVTMRAASDSHFFLMSSSYSLCDMDDNRGSGCTPGDVAMCELLQDNGYSTKLIPDKALCEQMWQVTSGNPTTNVFGVPYTIDTPGVVRSPQYYFDGTPGPAGSGGTGAWTPDLAAMLVVVSGSGSSADCIPPNTWGVPIMIGEHSDLGSGDASLPGGHGEHFLYSHYSGSHGNDANSTGLYQYMKVLAPNHPIMQGIPLVAAPGGDGTQTYVKIIRDPYPNELSHMLTGETTPCVNGLPNYQVSTTYVDINPGQCVPAPGLQILGVSGKNTNWVLFACMDQGGGLGPTTDAYSPWFGLTTSPTRVVQYFVCEQGGNNARRCFNALTVWGRILFVRAAKWAMWENLSPWQGLGIIDVGMVSPNNIKLTWTGSKNYNYRIYGSSSITSPNWIPVVDSIVNTGEGNPVSRTLNIASATAPAYLKVGTLPEDAAMWVRP